MRQPTLSDNGFEKFRKKTRKELFLDEMEVIIPWKDLMNPSIRNLKGLDGRPLA